MPWKEVSLMSLRREFVQLAQGPKISLAELCRRFNISRKTGYKWLTRYKEEGVKGLQDRSRRPHRIVLKVREVHEKALLHLRRTHPTWGARKLRRKLQEMRIEPVPACSTITTFLHRHGLIVPDGGRRDWRRFESPAPNALWQMDFKSPVSTLAGPCQPLTVLDDYSRFNLCLKALSNQQGPAVQEALEGTFRRYGLPNVLLMNNGPPWGNDSEFRYTTLTVWMLRLGIRVSHSRSYHPQTLGKDERFHRTLDEELLSRYQWQDLVHLQQKFDPWRNQYNFERPHEALGLAVPASRYRPSLRSMPETLPPIEYPSAVEVRKVQDKGHFFFRGKTFWVSRAFHRYPIGIRPTTTDGLFEVMFCHEVISKIDLRSSS